MRVHVAKAGSRGVEEGTGQVLGKGDHLNGCPEAAGGQMAQGQTGLAS